MAEHGEEREKSFFTTVYADCAGCVGRRDCPDFRRLTHAGFSPYDCEERTQLLLRELDRANVEEVLFFVTTKHINADSEDRLHAYTKAGHRLANHSHDHASANELTADEVLIDAYTLNLKKFDNTLPLYRFPYLHHGKDSEARQAIRDGLAGLGYGIGYVTVDNFDWYIDSQYRQAVEAGKKVNMEQLGRLYVDTLWDAIKFYDEVAEEALGRSPKHVLLLHENDLAATFIGDLVRRIESQGWKVISPRDAYSDPITRIEGDLSFTKQGRVAAVARQKGVPVEKLRHESENTDYIDELFEHYKIVGPQ